MMQCEYEGMAFDKASVRTVDNNGYLHVGSSHITKAAVNPYLGREVPGGVEHGYLPHAMYYGLRDPEELQKSLPTWAGVPLHTLHHMDSADDPQKASRVGSVGTEPTWNAPYVDAALTIWDSSAIEAIKNGSLRELSCAYIYSPDFTPGEYEGVHYDFVMRDIRGNHVALVEKGRAGPDVLVADSDTIAEGANNMEDSKKLAEVADTQNAPAAEAAMDTAPEAAAEDACGKDKAPAKDARDAEFRKAMDACGLDDNEANFKAFSEGVKYAEGLEDPKLDKGADKDPEPVTEKKAKDSDKKAAKDAAPVEVPAAPVAALDADAIKAEAVKETREHMRSLFKAVDVVRPLVGNLDALAFDSAEAVYAETLKQKGFDPTAYPSTAWQGMVDVVLAAKAETPSVTAAAQDAAPKAADFDGPFQGLKRIHIS